ncbi:iron ABC transporter substrate-binding protein [Desulfobulbus oligotrophicus]|uniref:Iron ABC transporter substrate-binding protein n=1 Tax=Desulfobulbus oligotrophicus TaxID=1909699 RepID=A0A7T5VER5_9BACT|nr:iron ABC transporter substrate-binding protein [Desulfobulbus oligotrophicus]QQG66570.1 iron ABC transporter substrate-binding protein [Desulfobulbus oligotrophicus]
MIYRALVLLLLLFAVQVAQGRTVTDASGRTVVLPDTVKRVICSGSGCLRLLCYLQAQDRVVAVDDIETRHSAFDARPYALANPQFKDMPVFGQFRGLDNPEIILTLDPAPQVIFKIFMGLGDRPDKLQAKTGIPVVAIDSGDLGARRPQFQAALRLMGEVVGRSERAETVIAYFEKTIHDLQARTAGISVDEQPSVYLSGVAFKGPHGLQSTEPAYPPFTFIGARNLALQGAGKSLSHSIIAREQIVSWNPDYLFVDLSTLQMGEKAGGLYELRTDPAYATLRAVTDGQVFGVLPYNWYAQNFESILANAYFIGKTLYPDRFQDIDPAVKTDEIYTSVIGKPVFSTMNTMFSNLIFTRLLVR